MLWEGMSSREPLTACRFRLPVRSIPKIGRFMAPSSSYNGVVNVSWLCFPLRPISSMLPAAGGDGWNECFFPFSRVPWAHAKKPRSESLSLVAAQIFDITELWWLFRVHASNPKTEFWAAKTLMSARRCQKSTMGKTLTCTGLSVDPPALKAADSSPFFPGPRHRLRSLLAGLATCRKPGRNARRNYLGPP